MSAAVKVLEAARGRLAEGRAELVDALLAVYGHDEHAESCAMAALRLYRAAEFDVAEALDWLTGKNELAGKAASS